ncbi:MAG: type II toxin-antitoxin system YoeB family toxin [Chitinophagales bacterium]
MYQIHLHPKAKEDIERLKKENNRLPTKIWDLVFSIFKNPIKGLGKPEQLKGDLNGWFS